MKKWRILRANAEVVAKMEGIQDAYQRPYDPIVPVVCIDETSKQLIQQTRILCELGQPEKVDYEFVRKGVTKIFMICEPLVGRRQTVVTKKNHCGFCRNFPICVRPTVSECRKDHSYNR